MIASNQLGESSRRRDAEEALARVPERAFGQTDWVRRAVQACALTLGPAIESGQAHRIANAVQAIAHAPTVQQLDDVVGAVCDALLAEAYALRNSRMISLVAAARPVIRTAIDDIRGSSERAAIEPALLRETINGHAGLIELHDPKLAERLGATGVLAARIAEALKLPPATVIDVEFAGRLHDVGLIQVPAAVRAKGAALTKDERELLQRHPLVGEAFLRSIPALSHLARTVRSHHERYDGSGYPDGLRGDEIPIESRIIAVADTFVGLITETPHHKPIVPHDACTQIAMRAGTRFDPDVVTATLRLLRFRHRANRSA